MASNDYIDALAAALCAGKMLLSFVVPPGPLSIWLHASQLVLPHRGGGIEKSSCPLAMRACSDLSDGVVLGQCDSTSREQGFLPGGPQGQGRVAAVLLCFHPPNGSWLSLCKAPSGLCSGRLSCCTSAPKPWAGNDVQWTLNTGTVLTGEPSAA